jgi:cardiolipin synthase
MDWPLIISIALGLLQIAGIIAAGDAIMTGRTSQGTIAWVLALLLLPSISIWFYFIFGSRRLLGYVRARRRGRVAQSERLVELLKRLEPFACEMSKTPGQRALLERLASLPACSGNDVRVLIDPDETFDTIFADIDAAKVSVVVQFYILRDDALGRRLRDHLLAARQRGLQVLVMYDYAASPSLRSWSRPLRRAGVQIEPFRTNIGPRNRLRLNFRNHRKLVLLDGKVALLGGYNIGDEYLGRVPRFAPWRDTHVRIAGPAALACQLAFCEDWFWATKLTPELPWDPTPHGNQSAMIVPSGPADDVETAALLFVHLITQAKERLWIATPYFVPDEAKIQALQAAALRGVDVRIILPQRADEPLVWLASFSYYEEVLPQGVKIYRYQSGFMHQKVLVSDDLSLIGSANFDNRSFRINFELSALLCGEATQRTVEMLQRDMERCYRVSPTDFSKRSWWFRVGARAARLFAPIL